MRELADQEEDGDRRQSAKCSRRFSRKPTAETKSQQMNRIFEQSLEGQKCVYPVDRRVVMSKIFPSEV